MNFWICGASVIGAGWILRADAPVVSWLLPYCEIGTMFTLMPIAIPKNRISRKNIMPIFKRPLTFNQG